MPYHREKRAHKSVVGPSIIVKRILDEDTFADFCQYNAREQWEKNTKNHRTDAIWREDPLDVHDYAVPYSLDKKGRWDLPEIIESSIESLQDPSLNLRVSASLHTCSRGDRVPLVAKWPWGKTRSRGPEEHPTLAYHNVTRDGQVQHRTSDKRAALSTMDSSPEPAGNHRNPSRSSTGKCQQKQDDQFFQKLHVRYTVLSMTEDTGRVYKKSTGHSRFVRHRRPLASVHSDDLEYCSDSSDEKFFVEDIDETEEPHSKTLADFFTTKKEKKTRTKRTKRATYCDEAMSASIQFPLMEENDSISVVDDFEIIPTPIKVELSLDFLSQSFDCMQCETCFEYKQVLFTRCYHNFCGACWLRQIEVSLSDGHCEIGCMAHNCQQSITASEARSLLSAESFLLVQSALTAARVKKGVARYCPQCHEAIDYSGKIDHCSCGASLCGHCPSLFHSPLSCRDADLYQQYLAMNGMASLYEIIPIVNRITDLVRCPGCGVPLQRERGCDHMTCVCGVQFCYKCGKERVGPHNSNNCKKQQHESIILLDVVKQFSTFPIKELSHAASRRTELNDRKKEIKYALRTFSTSARRRILRVLAAITLLHESAVLRSSNDVSTRLKAGQIELIIWSFLNTKSSNQKQIAEKCTRLDEELQLIISQK